MMVTATRDTDGKMCQIVDVVGRDRKGFKELDGDSMTGYRTFMVVPDDDDDDESDDAAPTSTTGASRNSSRSPGATRRWTRPGTV